MLAELGIESVLDLLTTYPRRYIDRTRQADVSDLVVGDEAAVLATVQSAHAAPGPHRSRRRRRGRARRHRPPQDRLLQPALAGQAARGGHRGDLLREGDRVPGQPPDGQPRRRRGGRRGARAADPAHPARLPGLGQGRPDQLGDRHLGRRGARARPASSPTPCRPSGAPRSTCGTGPRRSAPSIAPSRSRSSSPPAAASSSTSSSACSSRSCCAAAPSRSTPARCTTTSRPARSPAPCPTRWWRASSPGCPTS